MEMSLPLGLKNLDPPGMELRKLGEEAGESGMVMFLISAGADPSAELEALASETPALGHDKYHQVPMGQGQQELALKTLKSAAEAGDWICLQNLHLVIAWLPTLYKSPSNSSMASVQEIMQLKPKQGFRLWMTTEVHDKFPWELLERSVKVAVEAPPGLKRNLGRTYEMWEPSAIESGSTNRAQALLALATFHAVVQERRNFIPQGWTKFYEFNNGDLRAGVHVLDEAFKRGGSQDVQWEFVQGLMENAIYGGRVDNPMDMRILLAYVRSFFCPDTIPSSGKAKRDLCGGAIVLPDAKSKKAYLDLINRLDDDDNPKMFGLPVNITCSWERLEAARVIAQLRHMGSGRAASDKFDRDAWSAALTPLLNLWKKLNQGAGIHSMNLGDLRKETAKESDSGESLPPLKAFLAQEWLGAVELVQSIHHSLAALSKAIRGTAPLTAATKKLAASLLKQETPLAWETQWEGPENATEYLTAVMSRAGAIKDWLRKAQAESLRTDTLDLAQLFHPDTFLNALRQQTARELGKGMDQLKLVASWKDSYKSGVKVGGLMVEGATFDGSSLRETAFNSPPVASVPTVTIAWVPKEESEAYGEEESVLVPLYTGQTRERVVTSLRVPCARGDANKWLIAAVAFFLKD